MITPGFFIIKIEPRVVPSERRQLRKPDNRNDYPVEPQKAMAAFRSAQDFSTILKNSSNK
jgi:hypothetical protein